MSRKRNMLKNGLLGVARHLTAILFLLLPSIVVAQGLEVSKPLTLTTRQEAVQYERFDYNLNLCAMVVVYLDDDNVDFQGDVRTQQYRGNGEWWVWMIQGANWLSVTIPNYTPLRMEFNPLASGKTYEVHIRPAVPKLLLTVTEPFHQDMSRTDASKYSRLDAQGRTCALVRIGLVLPEAKFTGAVHSRYLNSEWMVWLSPGTTSLGISAQGYQPLTVQFESVQAAAAYLMTVSKTGEVVSHKPSVETRDEWVLSRKQKQPEAKSTRRTPWWGISLGIGMYDPVDRYGDRYGHVILNGLNGDLAFYVKGSSSFGPFLGVSRMDNYTIIHGGGIWKYTWNNNSALICRVGFTPGEIWDNSEYASRYSDDLFIVGVSYKFRIPLYISMTASFPDVLKAFTFGLGWSFGGKLR